MLVSTTAKQHQSGDLYSVLILFSECGIINLVEKQNCTVHNGTWYNHTCYIVSDGVHDKYNVNLTSEYMMRSVLASRKSPSDEYFQYVISIALLLLLGLFPSSGVAAMVLNTGTHLQYLTNERYFSRPDENCESHTVIQKWGC